MGRVHVSPGVPSHRSYGMTHLQSVDELGHRDFRFRVAKHVEGLERLVVGAVFELETHKVAEFGRGTAEKLERQRRRIVGCGRPAQCAHTEDTREATHECQRVVRCCLLPPTCGRAR